MRIFLIIVTTLFLFFLVASKSEILVGKIAHYKYSSNSLLGSDKYTYGDLYGMSYFPLIKEPVGFDPVVVPEEKFVTNKRINLCIVHDSYLSSSYLKSKAQLAGVDTIYDIEYPWWRNSPVKPIELKKDKTNILLFEIVERNLNALDSLTAMNLVKSKVNLHAVQEPKKTAIVKNILNAIFNKNTEVNLEFIIFDSRIFTAFKEFKAKLRYYLFEKVNSDVIVSQKGNYLFYSPTKSSITDSVTMVYLSSKVNLLNNIYTHYKAMGFQEVYFSIIPNPISVIQPDCQNYNNLIPNLQNNELLKMKMIDIYTKSKNTPHKIFYRSDTHWNMNGFNLWLNELNRSLTKP